MAEKKRGLGKGLDALFSENAADENTGTTLSLNEIEPNRDQPRKDFDEDALSDLADSITRHGLLQPIVVRPRVSGVYEIIAGERRWRACRMAGLTEVPVIIRDLDEQSSAEVALVENLQREDLNPFEEAAGYRSLADGFSLTQEEIAKSVGKSRTAVANALRLLGLPDDMLAALRSGALTAGQARTLLAAKTPERQKEMFTAALAGVTVRVLEQMAKQTGKSVVKKNDGLSTFQREVQLSLKQNLHRAIKIKSNGKGKGLLTVEFYSDKELREFAQKLSDEQ